MPSRSVQFSWPMRFTSYVQDLPVTLPDTANTTRRSGDIPKQNHRLRSALFSRTTFNKWSIATVEITIILDRRIEVIQWVINYLPCSAVGQTACNINWESSLINAGNVCQAKDPFPQYRKGKKIQDSRTESVLFRVTFIAISNDRRKQMYSTFMLRYCGWIFRNVCIR